MFREYAEHGWVLVPIRAGGKSPSRKDWSSRDNCIANPFVASKLKAVGLAHAYSGTCALDVDDLAVARGALLEEGVDLDRLLEAPNAVRIESGSPNKAKLLYRLNEPLPSKVLALTADKRHAAQLRCATADGKTVQDLLPPSLHPENGCVYRWVGDWKCLPELPPELLAVWKEKISPAAQPGGSTAPSASESELRDLVFSHDPDCNYTDWIRLGMVIHHESAGAGWGFDLWDEWSKLAGEKYRGRADLIPHWQSFKGEGENSVTIGTLRAGRAATSDDFTDLGPLEGEEDERDPWEAQTPRFTLVHASEWANRPPPTWLVKDILPYQDLAMVYGAPGSGKSFWMLDVALAIAGAADWRSSYKTDHGAVVWLAAEAAGSMRNRIQAYIQGRSLKMEDHQFWIVGETPNLSDAVNTSSLVDTVKGVAPKLIVVDTLSAASGGANENSGEDMNMVLAACRLLHAETGALIVIIHHSGKDSSRGARGWSGLQGAVNTEIEIVHLPDSPARVAKLTKQRDAEGGVELPFQLVPVPVTMEDTSCVVEHFHTAQLAAQFDYSEPIEIGVEEEHMMALLFEYENDSHVDDIETVEFNDLL